MPWEFRPSYNKVAGSILASAFVVMTGAIGLAFALVIAGGDPQFSVWVFVLTLIPLVLLAWLIRATLAVDVRGAYHWVLGRKPKSEEEYVPKKAKRAERTYGSNRPPTSEELRDMKDGLRNWVPNRGSRKG